jgi:hypothetical protein
LTEGLGPLPAYAHEFRPRWPGDDGGFTGAQMRAYALAEVLKERERWRAAAQKAEDALTWSHGGEPLPTLEREALDLLRPLLRA